jgi:hypothetical protein
MVRMKVFDSDDMPMDVRLAFIKYIQDIYGHVRGYNWYTRWYACECMTNTYTKTVNEWLMKNGLSKADAKRCATVLIRY